MTEARVATSATRRQWQWRRGAWRRGRANGRRPARKEKVTRSRDQGRKHRVEAEVVDGSQLCDGVIGERRRQRAGGRRDSGGQATGREGVWVSQVEIGGWRRHERRKRGVLCGGQQQAAVHRADGPRGRRDELPPGEEPGSSGASPGVCSRRGGARSSGAGGAGRRLHGPGGGGGMRWSCRFHARALGCVRLSRARRCSAPRRPASGGRRPRHCCCRRRCGCCSRQRT